MSRTEITSTCLNGELRIGDMVISNGSSDYAFLLGVVIEIVKLGTPEHEEETGNDTDNIHVNFYDVECWDEEGYSRRRKAKPIRRAKAI